MAVLYYQFYCSLAFAHMIFPYPRKPKPKPKPKPKHGKPGP